MKAIILLNGEPYRGKIEDEGAVVYCCDGAFDWAKGRVRIDVNLRGAGRTISSEICICSMPHVRRACMPSW